MALTDYILNIILCLTGVPFIKNSDRYIKDEARMKRVFKYRKNKIQKET